MFIPEAGNYKFNFFLFNIAIENTVGGRVPSKLTLGLDSSGDSAGGDGRSNSSSSSLLSWINCAMIILKKKLFSKEQHNRVDTVH